jgi:hypothetical protein
MRVPKTHSIFVCAHNDTRSMALRVDPPAFVSEQRPGAGGPALATTEARDWTGGHRFPHHQARSRYPLIFTSVKASDLVVSRTASESANRGL